MFFVSADKILEEIASDGSSDPAALVRMFISVSKDRAVKPESVTAELAVKGLSLSVEAEVFFSISMKSMKT